MDTDPVLSTSDFSRAKAALSELMTEVVYEHRPRVISRRRGKERMLLVRADDLAEFLRSFRFKVETTKDKDEVTLALPVLGLLGFGETVEKARADLLTELAAYARDFFERASFYSETDRAAHAPWLLRFALTPDELRADLLAG
jgi:Antitoxin of toxin-antitoxin, RelE / RelB, TA system